MSDKKAYDKESQRLGKQTLKFVGWEGKVPARAVTKIGSNEIDSTAKKLAIGVNKQTEHSARIKKVLASTKGVK